MSCTEDKTRSICSACTLFSTKAYEERQPHPRHNLGFLCSSPALQQLWWLGWQPQPRALSVSDAAATGSGLTQVCCSCLRSPIYHLQHVGRLKRYVAQWVLPPPKEFSVAFGCSVDNSVFSVGEGLMSYK